MKIVGQHASEESVIVVLTSKNMALQVVASLYVLSACGRATSGATVAYLSEYLCVGLKCNVIYMISFLTSCIRSCVCSLLFCIASFLHH